MGIFHLNLWITICADTLVNFLNMLLMSIMGPYALKVSFYYSIHTGKKKKLLEENKEEGRERGGIVQLKKPPSVAAFVGMELQYRESSLTFQVTARGSWTPDSIYRDAACPWTLGRTLPADGKLGWNPSGCTYCVLGSNSSGEQPRALTGHRYQKTWKMYLCFCKIHRVPPGFERSNPLFLTHPCLILNFKYDNSLISFVIKIFSFLIQFL